jgi:N-acetylneuraminate synthase
MELHISRQIAAYVVYFEDSIQFALQKINKNTRRLVYCLSDSGTLEGIVTDGDFRRWVVNVHEIDLQKPVREIANTSFVRARLDDNPQSIEALFNSKITSIPIIDESGRLAAIAWREQQTMRFGSKEIGDDKPAFLIAEIGNNHNGSLELAKRL